MLRPHLEGQGHRVFAPTLSGLGERDHLTKLDLINLDTHVADIANFIRWRDLRDVILRGHSYGGMVIMGVADQMPDRIGKLVFMDAEMPKVARRCCPSSRH